MDGVGVHLGGPGRRKPNINVTKKTITDDSFFFYLFFVM